MEGLEPQDIGYDLSGLDSDQYVIAVEIPIERTVTTNGHQASAICFPESFGCVMRATGQTKLFAF